MLSVLSLSAAARQVQRPSVSRCEETTDYRLQTTTTPIHSNIVTVNTFEYLPIFSSPQNNPGYFQLECRRGEERQGLMKKITRV